jgi:hypothetical protein
VRVLRELLRRPLLLALVVVALVLVVPGGAAVVVKMVLDRREERRRVRVALREAAVMFGLDPDYLDAIGKVEGPNWILDARSTDPRDEARGGSFGPTQISERTARGAGYTGSMEAFRTDAALAAHWTAVILRQAEDRRHLETLADYVAAWNAGRDDADRNDNGDLEELPPTHPTRTTYLPAALAALAYVQRNPPT